MVRPIIAKTDSDVVDDDVNEVEGKKGDRVSENQNCNSGSEKATPNKHTN